MSPERSVATLPVPADHPAYSGHFPGAPVLPAAVLLDAAVHAVEGHGGRWQVASAKFQSRVLPGELLTLEHEGATNGSVHFTIRSNDRLVASGVLVPSKGKADSDDKG